MGNGVTHHVIIDCDPGTDDAVALWLALASPELSVEAITVAGGNVGLEQTLGNARAVVSLTGARVPVHAGAARPLLGRFTSAARVHGQDGLNGVSLPAGGPPAPGLAADAIRARLRTATIPLTLIGIGPATNIALALATEPTLAARIAEIVLMSGAWGEGNATPAAEFNAWSDPEALAIVLACGRPITLVTLELTAQALVTPSRIAALRRCGRNACLRAACDILAAAPSPARMHGAPLHDPCAIAWLLRPDLFSGRDCAVRIETSDGEGRGRTHIDRWQLTGQPANAHVLERLDADGFFDLLGRRLAALP